MSTQFQHELEIKDIEDVCLSFAVDQLPQERVEKKIHGNSGIAAQHNCEVGKYNFSHFFLLVVLNEQKYEFLVENWCHFVFAICEIMQEIKQTQ